MHRYQSGLMARIANPLIREFKSHPVLQTTESNAAGLVLRLALKTRFSEMGWGSTPLLSANNKSL